ncbi:ABC transporter permease [Rhodanobacter sp. C06]|uniref:ABC transporter permease n=1 Tax=Rhodanobacter sp. C06 TaxID=1945854 RepID=UPI0009873961|nr:FtsX-like permease family protein [Rhodanobacter sp. C06]OOG36127.1 ABC transporter permease [Rhodanobacter sp. C06]OOG36160.1 ABC transporter permease [Rhodanobacter sp. C06]
MQIRPILSTLRHHKLTAILLTLQVAFTCAIVCNVVFMVAQRVQRISVPTGIAENELSAIHSRGIEKGENVQARHVADLAALRAIPGVRSAVAVSYSLPLNQSESSSGMCPSKQALDRAIQRNSIDGSGCVQPALYDGTPGLIATLGLHLAAGRDFLPDEYVSKGKPAVAIITRALAQKLYPGRSALGQSMYDGDNFFRVVGIVDTLLRPALSKPGVDGDSMIWPQRPDGSSVTYVLRSAPQDRQRVLKAAEAALLQASSNRIIDPKQMQTYTQIRNAYFQRDTTMIGLLIASVLGLLFVTALGIAGLANFWVQQRTRSIGIRRAIGATRGDILRYFQTENLLIVTVGIVLGVLLAVLMNLLLMTHYELPRLPLWYLPIGAAVLWALGQLSVLSPALRAAQVPPVVATRSV